MPWDRGNGLFFWFGINKVWSTDPCQLPATDIRYFFLGFRDLAILSDLITLSEPVVQNTIFLKLGKKNFINLKSLIE